MLEFWIVGAVLAVVGLICFEVGRWKGYSEGADDILQDWYGD